MRQIKLTKAELERLIKYYSSCRITSVDRLIETCKDLDKASDDDLRLIYNAFCRYLRVSGLCIYPMSRFHLLTFADSEEQKRLTEYVDLSDCYFSLDMNGKYGYYSFNSLRSCLIYRTSLCLKNIKDMLECTFSDEEEGEEDE